MTDQERIESILKDCEYGFISYSNLHDNDDHGIRIIQEALILLNTKKGEAGE